MEFLKTKLNLFSMTRPIQSHFQYKKFLDQISEKYGYHNSIPNLKLSKVIVAYLEWNGIPNYAYILLYYSCHFSGKLVGSFRVHIYFHLIDYSVSKLCALMEMHLMVFMVFE